MKRAILAVTLAAIAICAVSMLLIHKRIGPRLMPSAQGYGTAVPEGPGRVKPARPVKPLDAAEGAYRKGDYKSAEAEAQRVIDANRGSRDPGRRKVSVQAREIMAFSAARRKNMRLARERFGQVSLEASKLPDKGKQEALPGEIVPNLTEQGAYQRAVCTAALGDKAAAEKEYLQFIRDYPESPLITGAAKRIALLHGGHTPKVAEEAWARAIEIGKARDLQRRRDAAVCGPECVAELLRRRGETPDLKSLAKEMRTDENGTSLAALASSLKKRGYSPKGLALTRKGLRSQRLPLVALIAPGHFVIVDKIDDQCVTVCDPTYAKLGKPTKREIAWSEWMKIWGGVALTV